MKCSKFLSPSQEGRFLAATESIINSLKSLLGEDADLQKRYLEALQSLLTELHPELVELHRTEQMEAIVTKIQNSMAVIVSKVPNEKMIQNFLDQYLQQKLAGKVDQELSRKFVEILLPEDDGFNGARKNSLRIKFRRALLIQKNFEGNHRVDFGL